jgi:hypothetical protein
MKIIKQIEVWDKSIVDRPWIYGLGDDGKLYARVKDSSTWLCTNEKELRFSLKEMISIVKAFEPLLIFL